MFKPLSPKFDFPQAEAGVLAFWDQHDVFRRSIEQRRDGPRFVFYEGPPTANGLPHPGHVLTRAMKDLFPRYRAMCGYLVERKAGWDTHGLPVEREVCKELGIRTKQEIEAYGVEKFNLKCIQSVFRYTKEWEDLTRRLGFWVNLDEAYVTYHQSYVESVWWSLKTLFERGVLYQGHKIVWWWAQGGTALSSGEVGEGYRQVDDPSVFVKFPLVEGSGFGVQGSGGTSDVVVVQSSALPSVRQSSALPKTSLLVWTTTPWTLISNHFAAVHPDLDYALVHDPVDDEHLYVAAALVETIAKKVKRELKVVSTCKGTDLIGVRYSPPFDCYYAQKVLPGADFGQLIDSGDPDPRLVHFGQATRPLKGGLVERVGWRVLGADFVAIESGTGLVHEAPAFGEVDFDLLQQERTRFLSNSAIPLLCAVSPDGTFNSLAPAQYQSRWVKDCDKDIVRELRDTRKTPWGTPLLYHQETYRHDYPFCPQAPDDPLIQYARTSWFVRTSAFKDEFLKNNAAIQWLPEHIQEGRFGDFLRNNVDWALSRERYWGTPLPIWRCEKCGKMEAIGSFAELKDKSGATDGGYWDCKVAEHEGEAFPEHLRVHKPYIDEWTYACMTCQGTGNTEQGPAETAKGDVAAAPRGGRGEGEAPAEPARMRRVPEVIDCWWDAGSMPFAQWGFPHAAGSVDSLSNRYPADFISEAIDQTRGWFYALLAINTLLFGCTDAPVPGILEKIAAGGWLTPAGLTKAQANWSVDRPVWCINAPAHDPDRSSTYGNGAHPFKSCIVLGLIMGEDGNKMSKKLRNYKEPSYIFDSYGADAMRWYFFSAQAPWTSVRFQEAAIRDSQREFLVKLHNVLSFFTIYASIDGFDPRRRDEPGNPMGWRPSAERTELDRWIITELRRTIAFVRESMDRFENYPAAQRLNDFVDALSNWYVRRSRQRFWRGERDQEKWDAYHTLYGCLRGLSHLIAPFTPYFAETMHQHLRVPEDLESVHLCDYPKPEDITFCDDSLAATMDSVRQLVALGRAARTVAKLKVRQPLALVEIMLARPDDAGRIRDHAALIAEELNVKRVEFTSEADHYVSYKVVPNFKAIGAKYRELVPGIKAALAELKDAAGARRTLLGQGSLPLTIAGQTLQLTPQEVEIRLEARPGWSAAQDKVGVVVISTELSPELLDEGLVRELISHVQQLRKEQELSYEARIDLYAQTSDKLAAVIIQHAEIIRSECLVQRIEFTSPPAGVAITAADIEGHATNLAIVRAN